MKKSYSDLLKSPKWQKKRLQILKRDKWKCKLCGDEETMLQIHHKEYINGQDPWNYDNSLLVTLCSDCHLEVEKLKKEYPDIYFDNIKIYKSNNWIEGSRIMFVSIFGSCDMIIYDDNDKWLCGYTLSDDLPAIIKILKRSYNG